MLPPILSRVVRWTKAHHFYGIEFEERDESLRVFMRTWEKGTFRRVVVAVTDRFAVDATPVISAWVSCGCRGCFGVPCCCFWRVACVGRHLQRVSGKWVQSQACGLPRLRSASPETMPAEGVLFRLWIPSL